MTSNDDDWKAEMERASEQARRNADEATDAQLAEGNEQADKLAATFRDLKLSDRASYDAIARVVEESTARNEAIGEVVTRLKALGDASLEIVNRIQTLSPAGALKALSKALRD